MPATIARLTAPSLRAAAGITLGGQSFAPATTTGELTGTPVLTSPPQTRQGAYVVRLPAGSAAILTH